MHDDSLCAMIRMAPNKKHRQRDTTRTPGANSEGVRSNKAQCRNQGSPQPGSPRSQRAATTGKRSSKEDMEGGARSCYLGFIFLWSAPVAFRRVALETPEWTSRDSNHHRQSVSAGKTNAIPTEPSGRLHVILSLCVRRFSFGDCCEQLHV